MVISIFEDEVNNVHPFTLIQVLWFYGLIHGISLIFFFRSKENPVVLSPSYPINYTTIPLPIGSMYAIYGNIYH